MKEIPDKSIDMVCCDLPYGTTSCQWDVIIPFEKLWEQYHRILKKNGVVALFGSQPFTTTMIASNLGEFKEEIVWLKNKQATGFSKNHKHMKIHENIEIFSADSNYTYNPQKWLIAEKEFITQRKTFHPEYVGNNIYGEMYRIRSIDTGERFPLSIVSCRVPFTPQKNKVYADDIELRLHPTQKPVTLLEYLIKTYTNEGETVLDNCMGSGSTGIACINTGRCFIGMELNEEYFNIAQTRINERLSNMELKS